MSKIYKSNKIFKLVKEENILNKKLECTLKDRAQYYCAFNSLYKIDFLLFQHYFKNKIKDKTLFAITILYNIESRLDVIIWRAGITLNILQAQELIYQGYILIDGKVKKSKNYNCSVGNIISISNIGLKKFKLQFINLSNKIKYSHLKIIEYKKGISEKDLNKEIRLLKYKIKYIKEIDKNEFNKEYSCIYSIVL